MIITNYKFTGLLSILFLLIGCKAAPVYNVYDVEITAADNVRLHQIERAILKGSRIAGWRAKPISKGNIIAKYFAKRGKLAASVNISFNRRSYSITYRDSKNLKYTVRDNIPEPSDNVFTEYNPFIEDEELGPAPPTIHKVYNKWVRTLEEKINLTLMNLDSNKTYARKIPKQPYRRSSCSDSPTTQSSGSANVSQPHVNIRSGASTKCSIIGNISQSEIFSILGKKNNWYFISRSQGDTGWIYAPLVNRSSKPTTTVATSVTRTAPPPPPPPPIVPRKKISIAVIKFKSLNQEAHEISLGDLVSETFTSALVNSSAFKIIEREQLDKVIKEMEMSKTGFIDTTDAVEIGKILHADAIITGSVALLAGQIQLNARIIDIESAYVISAESKTTRYTLQNINTVVNSIVRKLSSSLSGT